MKDRVIGKNNYCMRFITNQYTIFKNFRCRLPVTKKSRPCWNGPLYYKQSVLLNFKLHHTIIFNECLKLVSHYTLAYAGRCTSKNEVAYIQ